VPRITAEYRRLAGIPDRGPEENFPGQPFLIVRYAITAGIPSVTFSIPASMKAVVGKKLEDSPSLLRDLYAIYSINFERRSKSGRHGHDLRGLSALPW